MVLMLMMYNNKDMIEKVKERFISYAGEYTTSNPESKKCPTTRQQFVFMRKLEKELKSIGIDEVDLD